MEALSRKMILPAIGGKEPVRASGTAKARFVECQTKPNTKPYDDSGNAVACDSLVRDQVGHPNGGNEEQKGRPEEGGTDSQVPPLLGVSIRFLHSSRLLMHQ